MAGGINIPIIKPDVAPTMTGAPQLTDSIKQQANPYIADTGGQTLGKAIGDADTTIKQKVDTNALINGQQALDDWETQNIYGPNGALAKKGGDAVGITDDTVQKYQADMADYKKQNIFGVDQSLAFDRMVATRQNGIARQTSSHENTQTNDYFEGSMKGTVDSGYKLAEQNANDPTQYEPAIGGSVDAYTAWAKQNGKSPEEIKMNQIKIQQDGYYGVLGVQATQDPEKFLDTVKDARDANSMKNDINAPRGIRNNNPGNIKGDDEWQGKTGADANGFVQFDTPANGARALAINLKNQQDKNGLNTIGEIIPKYAPSSDNNNTQAYVDSVSKQMGVAPDAKLDLSDPKTLSSFTSAVISHENGKQPYPTSVVQNAASAATTPGGNALSDASNQVADASGVIVPTQPTMPAQTGYKPFDAQDFKKQADIINFAESNLRQQQLTARANIDRQEKDTISMAEYGKQTTPLQASDFVKAYGRDEGAIKYKTYSDNYTNAQNVFATATQTPDQQSATLQQAKPQAGDADFANKMEKYNNLSAAITKTNTARNDDPITFGQQHNLIPAQPLNTENPQIMQQQLQDRASFINSFSQIYDTKRQLLTKDEANLLSQSMEKQTVDQKVALLKGMRDSLGNDNYSAIVQQIRPDSPVTALAADYLGKQTLITPQKSLLGYVTTERETAPADVVATQLLKGEALLNPTKVDKKEDGKGKQFPMPPDGNEVLTTGLRQDFDEAAGTAFAGNPKARDTAYQAFRAFYAATASDAGDYSGVRNEDIAKKSAKTIIGTASDPNNNSGKVLAPYGMDESQFQDSTFKAYQGALKQNGIDPKFADWGSVRFEKNWAVPDSYFVQSGNGYLLGKDKKPISIKLGG